MQTSEEKLGSQPLGKLMVSMAVPAVTAQFINVLYNIVDRIYIGHIAGYGDLALTGVGVTFPIITLISAFSAFAGMGGAPLASIELGRRNHEKAEQILGNSAAMMILFSIILTIGFSIFKTPVLYAFGASDATIGYGEDYIAIYLLGTIFVQLSVGLNTFISGQGSALTAMLSVLIGAVINIVLDPIFIFLFGMGVKGAALATILSQAVSAAWVLRFLTSQKSVIRLRKTSSEVPWTGGEEDRRPWDLSVYHAEHGKPGQRDPELWPAEIWRRSVRGHHVHYDQYYAGDRYPHPGTDPGRPAYHQL